MLKLKDYRIIDYLLTVLSIIVIIVSLSPLLYTDEGFTMGLINRNWMDVIRIDAMDVHPPFYYLVLKLFLTITTFWTKSFLIKVIFSRIFSFLCSVITFLFLQKILKLLNISKENKSIRNFSVFILLTIVPFKLMNMYNLFEIRMYALAAMLVTIQFFAMIEYSKQNNNKYIYIFTVCSLLSAYTHYISGFISGLFILGFMIFQKDNKLKYFLSGIIMILLYVPWIPIALSQFSLITGNHWWMDYSFFIKNIILLALFIILFLYPVFSHMMSFNKNDYRKQAFKCLIFVIIMTILIAIITSVAESPMFQGRYIYPILVIYSYLSFIIFMNNKKKFKFIGTIMLLLVLFGTCSSVKKQYINYDSNSINVYKNLHHYHKKNITIKFIGDLQAPILQTKLMYYKYNGVFVNNYSEYINSFYNSNIKKNRNNYYLNKYVYFFNKRGR
jgi:hypothetical protein